MAALLSWHLIIHLTCHISLVDLEAHTPGPGPALSLFPISCIYDESKTMNNKVRELRYLPHTKD